MARAQRIGVKEHETSEEIRAKCTTRFVTRGHPLSGADARGSRLVVDSTTANSPFIADSFSRCSTRV
jgi:hypothetical protein